MELVLLTFMLGSGDLTQGTGFAWKMLLHTDLSYWRSF